MAQAETPCIRVSVVFAMPEAATELTLKLPVGATVADAIARSKLDALHANLDIDRCPVGIFGKRTDRSTALADGDRVEVYRPLKVDPKEARQRRATRRRSNG